MLPARWGSGGITFGGTLRRVAGRVLAAQDLRLDAARARRPRSRARPTPSRFGSALWQAVQTLRYTWRPRRARAGGAAGGGLAGADPGAGVPGAGRSPSHGAPRARQRGAPAASSAAPSRPARRRTRASSRIDGPALQQERRVQVEQQCASPRPTWIMPPGAGAVSIFCVPSPRFPISTWISIAARMIASATIQYGRDALAPASGRGR